MRQHLTLPRAYIVKNLYVYHPGKEGTHILNCDASDYVIGEVLYQRNNNGEHKVTAHVSRSLKGTKRNCFTSEKETLAIVYCISKFRYYLVGQHFEILSDNQVLSFMLNVNSQMREYRGGSWQFKSTILASSIAKLTRTK